MWKPTSLAEMDAAAPMKFYLCTQPTDLRKGFDALAELARQVHGRSGAEAAPGLSAIVDVFSGGWFIFLNRRRDRMKILYWDKDGFALWYKRLEAGTFCLPRPVSAAGINIRASELAMILEGVDLRNLQRVPRLVRRGRAVDGVPV